MLRTALRPGIVKRSLIISLIVGTILNIINQGDTLMTSGDLTLWKCLLTYVVPYCVSTYGAVTALHAQANQPS